MTIGGYKLNNLMSNSTQNKCPFCNSELISLVLPSNPPQYKTHCPNCENSKVSNSTQNDWKKRFWEYYEGRKEKDGYINPSFLLLFIAKELADARREGHPTINGFCCACDYDIEFMKHDREFEIESLKKTCKHCGVIRGVKLHEDTDSHDRYQVGYNKAIDDVLATLREEEGETDLSIAIKEEGV